MAEELIYRQGFHDDVLQIAELLAQSGLEWPGPASTPYVAVRPSGEVVAVIFKTLCFHAEPLAAKEGCGFSVSKLGDLMKQSFVDLANETGHPISIYSLVQDNPEARAAAAKNGMVPCDGLLYEITINPTSTVSVTGGRADERGSSGEGARHHN